jgi:hypothetical protein
MENMENVGSNNTPIIPKIVALAAVVPEKIEKSHFQRNFCMEP